jgi:hypothetical protein
MTKPTAKPNRLQLNLLLPIKTARKIEIQIPARSAEAVEESRKRLLKDLERTGLGKILS